MESIPLTLQTGTRTLIVGKTGSGKTTLAEVLLRSRKFVVVFDAKGRINAPDRPLKEHWPGYVRYTDFNSVTQSKESKRIYAPSAFELLNPDRIDDFFRWVYDSRNWTLYVDEVMSISRVNVLPPHYFAILTRGRELNITLVSSTQRPSGIHNTVLSESEQFWVFALLMHPDRKKLEQVIPVSAEDIAALRDKRHEFIYATQSENSGVRRLKFLAKGRAANYEQSSSATDTVSAR